jgi:hypothetical protein
MLRSQGGWDMVQPDSDGTAVDLEYDRGHTRRVKVAISVPDTVGRAADRTARRLRVARSQLYARAVEEYVRRLEGTDITARLDAVYGKEASEIDAFTRAAARDMLKRARW